MPFPKRTAAAPSLLRSPRSSLELSKHGHIDAVLKELKVSSRRLRCVSVVLRDESNILERLYYKGKNQHRPALFWRRIVEARNNARRLRQICLFELVDNLRRAFFDESTLQK